MRIFKAAVVVALTAVSVDLFSECECWVTEHIDEWTDVRSVVLVCANQESESAVVFFDRGDVEFYDPTARADTNSLVSWEYRIGNLETRSYYLYWNSDLTIPGKPPFWSILHGVGEGETIRFRLRPYMSQETGRVNTLRDCHNASEAVAVFQPSIEEATPAETEEN